MRTISFKCPILPEDKMVLKTNQEGQEARAENTGAAVWASGCKTVCEERSRIACRALLRLIQHGTCMALSD